MKNGAFRKRRLYFTQVSNSALRDKELSLKAKGLYSLIQSYITLEDFTLYKSTLRNQCCEGEKAFENAWKELKDAGYLIQYKFKKENGHYCYEYDLLEEKNQTPKKEGVDNLQCGNMGCISNTDINNTDINNISQSVSQEIKQVIEQAEVEKYHDEDLKQVIKNTIKEIYMDLKTREIIKTIRIYHIDMAILKYRTAQEKQDIKNPKLYFKKCLLSAIDESGLRGLF